MFTCLVFAGDGGGESQRGVRGAGPQRGRDAGRAGVRGGLHEGPEPRPASQHWLHPAG